MRLTVFTLVVNHPKMRVATSSTPTRAASAYSSFRSSPISLAASASALMSHRTLAARCLGLLALSSYNGAGAATRATSRLLKPKRLPFPIPL